MKNVVKLTIYVLSCDRPDLCSLSIQSVLRSKTPECNVIVSENSSDGKVYEMLKKKFPKVKFVRRVPQLRSDDHFNTIIKECRTKYLVAFHDDDLLEESYCKKMISVMDKDKELSAAGSNSGTIKNGSLSENLFMGKLQSDYMIETPIRLLQPYLQISNFGPAPFPGYIYRMSKIKDLTTNPIEGGKHCDLFFLLKVLSTGKVKWISQKNMYYRVHKKGDSAYESITDRIQVHNIIKRNYCYKGLKNDLEEYRYFSWTLWLGSQKGKNYIKKHGIFSRTSRTIIRYVLIKTLMLIMTRNNFRSFISKRAFKKISSLFR